MVAKITFFPVDNGDMTLLQLADSNATSLLIDCKIRSSADDSEDEIETGKLSEYKANE